MTTPEQPTGPRDVPTLHRNLDSAHRSLTEAEDVLQELLAGGDPDTTALRAIGSAPVRQSYDELTLRNDQLRETLDWAAPDDLDALLTDTQRAELDAWRMHKRLTWSRDDILVVGLAGAVGILASVLDSRVDAGVRAGLAKLKDTDLLKGWENDAKRMPVDYMGPGFGGPAHRVKSSGHDLGRPLAALAQIRDGQFRAVRWVDGVRTTFATDPGAYVPVEAYGEALTLWMKHLVADFVTPMSLPLPGWTWLFEQPVEDVRNFARMTYQGRHFGEGLNMRSGILTPMLSFLSTEAIVRTHVHAKVYQATGTPKLSSAHDALMRELLLAGHSLVGAGCLGHTLFAAIAGQGPLSFRHLNAPVLLRVGWLAARVHAEARTRAKLAPPSWEELLLETTTPWLLDEAPLIDAAAFSAAV